MGCASCGDYSNGGSVSPSGMNGGNCSDQKAMNTHRPLEQLKNGDDNFCFNGIGDKECESLGKNTGIHPTDKHKNNDCDDLKALNDLGIGELHNQLLFMNMCNPANIKCWLFSLLSWIYNINKAIICSICGLWCTINKMKQAIKDLAYGNVDTQGSYVVLEETPELSVVVRKDGTFTYKWSDWNDSTNPWTKLGSGTLTGKLNLKLDVNKDGGLDYTIDGVHINSINYVTTNKWTGATEPLYYIQIPADGSRVWTRQGTVNKSWTENLNKTFAFKKSGVINPNSESSQIDFMTWGADWVNDDKVRLRFKFINNNSKIDLDC